MDGRLDDWIRIMFASSRLADLKKNVEVAGLHMPYDLNCCNIVQRIRKNLIKLYA
jgi:hypothetical protein